MNWLSLLTDLVIASLILYVMVRDTTLLNRKSEENRLLREQIDNLKSELEKIQSNQ